MSDLQLHPALLDAPLVLQQSDQHLLFVHPAHRLPFVDDGSHQYHQRADDGVEAGPEVGVSDALDEEDAKDVDAKAEQEGADGQKVAELVGAGELAVPHGLQEHSRQVVELQHVA